MNTNWLIFTFYLLVLLGLSGYGFHRLTILYYYLKHRKDVPQPKAHFDELPVVTVQLPVYNEMHVVSRLLKSVSEIDYPKDKLQIQVLDDSTDETTEICKKEVAKLQAQGLDAVYIYRENRKGFKAGALENGTKSAKGEFLFILDADFVPGKDILQKTIHFFTDEKIGLIQTRWGHINRDQNTLTRAQAMFLDGHHELEQTARNRSGRFFTFNGTGGMWRKSAITDAGGWEHDTLTEDMDLSYRAQLKGWEFIYLKDVVTPAELPADIDGFKSQQHRWTKGSIQCCKKCLFDIWKAPVALKVKLEATAHLTSNFAYLLLVVLCFLILPKQSVDTEIALFADHPWMHLLIMVPSLLFGIVSVSIFYLGAQMALRPKTWYKEIIYVPLLLALSVGMSINNAKAVLEAIFNHQTGFVRTPKYGLDDKKKPAQSVVKKGKKYATMKTMIPFIEMIFGVFFAGVVLTNAIDGHFMTALLLLPFPVGFFYTALPSIRRILDGLRENKLEESVDLGK